jgi:hypothetical protein
MFPPCSSNCPTSRERSGQTFPDIKTIERQPLSGRTKIVVKEGGYVRRELEVNFFAPDTDKFSQHFTPIIQGLCDF